MENARAYRQVNAANRAKDEFLATLSHELRTPLNAVLGWARMLRAGGARAGEAGARLRSDRTQRDAQLDLVEDLLDLSRIITGKFRLDVQTVDLGDVDRRGRRSDSAGSDGEADHRPRRHRSRLLCRARRCRPPAAGGLESAVERDQVHAAGRHASRLPRGKATPGHVVIEVSDTGEGIEPAVLPFVFDRFRQGESGTTRTHMGLGLGLAIVRHIIELHGGRVEATSAGKGQGATFRLFLPVRAHEPRAIHVDEPQVAQAPRRIPSRMLSGLRALVIDDDYDARELVTELLRSRGMEVTPVASAAEALAALDRHVPDIILSDIAMPELDGLELMRRVRTRSAAQGGDVPAVALTAYARPEDSERSLASGFQVHLEKPVDADRLISTVVALAGRTM